MVTYIKLSVKGQYLELEEALDPELYDNIGETYDDYLDNKFVELTSGQTEFHEEYPLASVKEVFDMELKQETIEEAKTNKIMDIEMYDISPNVNEFYYQEQPFWLDKDTRVGLMNSTTILKNAGETTTTLWLGDMHVTLPCDDVILMLSQLEIYALNCYNVTAEHKNAVNEMTDIDEVHNFDITADYPEKLHF